MNKQHNTTASEKCVVARPHETAMDRKFSSTFTVAGIPLLSIKAFPRLLGRPIFQGRLNMTMGGGC